MESFKFKLSNVHCQGCAESIEKVLSDLSSHILVSVPESSVTVVLPHDTNPKEVASRLFAAGFDVEGVDEIDLDLPSDKWYNKLLGKGSGRRKTHLENCTKCQQGAHGAHNSKESVSSESPSDLSGDTTQESNFFRATYSISGMTCASCQQAITTHVKEQLGPRVETFEVSLMNKSGTAIIANKLLANDISSIINDMGYEAELVEILPISLSKGWKLVAAIGGMTCASCSQTIVQQISPLSYVDSVDISLLDHSGTFILNDPSKASALKEAVEDIGYDFEQVELSEATLSQVKTKSRTVNLSVSGMFCEHCPEKINNELAKYGEAVVVDDPITLKHPYIKFSYIPDPSNNVTIRGILSSINSLESGKFSTKITHPLSLEERAMRMAKKEQRSLLIRVSMAITIAIPTFIIGIVYMLLLKKDNPGRMYFMEPMWAGQTNRGTWAMFFMATPSYFFVADVFHRKALKELRSLYRSGVTWKRRLFKFGSMNLLISLGTTIAYFASIAELALTSTARHDIGTSTTYFDSVVFLTMFLLMGRFLESYSKAKTASAMTSLQDLRPRTALLIEDAVVTDTKEKHFGESKEVLVDLLEVKDFIRVLPGMSPPADAIIFEGTSEFDESALTGESRPMRRTVGEQIFAGTVNCGTSPVIAQINALEGTSLLDSIISVVRQGQLHKAPLERYAEKLTGIFVPVVTAVAVIVWIIWLVLGLSGALPHRYLDIGAGGWTLWSLQFSISVFVIACPCGIGLAAPTALFVGSGLSAKYGILARGGGEAFQEGSSVEVVCFDKTGTLTEGGEPQVTNEYVEDEYLPEKSNLFALAKALELNSSHPLAIAVVNYVNATAGPAVKFTNSEEIAGKGLFAKNEHGEYLIGNETLLIDNKVQLSESMNEMLLNWKHEGKSVIILATKMVDENKFSAMLAFAAADKIRPESEAVVNALQSRGINVWMISGDNEVTAKVIAKMVGIDPENVIAGVLPEEKAAKISWLQRVGNSKNSKKSSSRAIVAMVGDGINDAPALSTADIGIAMGSGADIAMSSAKFVLLNSNLNSVLILLDIAKATFRRVKFNFAWALIYNLIGIPIAAGVIYPYRNSRLDPAWASLAMALSSLSVVSSSLLLKFYKPKKAVKSKQE